jgi:hypothetical protein
MSDVQTLLTRCLELGATLTPGPEGKLKIQAPAPLPEELRQELKQRKPEILALLEATSWLHTKLNPGPQRIPPLIAEWVGTLDNPTGRSLDALIQARWALKVEAYVGEDDRLWWQLPVEMVQ